MLSRHADRSVRRYFVAGLGPAAERRMRRHVDACGRCRSLYVRTLVAERALVPHRDEDGEAVYGRCGPRERERAVARLLGVIAERPERSRSARAWWWLVPAAAALLLVVSWPRPEPSPPLSISAFGHDLIARGADRSRPGSGVDLRLVCVSVSAVEREPVESEPTNPASRFEARELVDGDACGPDDVLFAAYTSRPPRLGFVFVLGVDSTGTHRYYPRPDQPESVRIWPGDVDRVLGRGIVVGRRHRVAGEVGLVAIFSPRPQTADDVETWAESLIAAGAAGDAAEWTARFEGSEVIVRRFEVTEP